MHNYRGYLNTINNYFIFTEQMKKGHVKTMKVLDL